MMQLEVLNKGRSLELIGSPRTKQQRIPFCFPSNVIRAIKVRNLVLEKLDLALID